MQTVRDDPSQGLPLRSRVVPEIYRVRQLDALPPTFGITARDAIRLADRTPTIRALRKQHPDVKPIAFISPLRVAQGAFFHWDIQYTAGQASLAEVEIGPRGGVLETSRGIDVGWPLLRGYPGVLGRALNRPYIWLPLCLLFLLPFFDPRRPFRLLHLDLLALLAFGISQYYFNRGKPGLSVPLVYPVIGYLAARMLFAVFRPMQRPGPLVPH